MLLWKCNIDKYAKREKYELDSIIGIFSLLTAFIFIFATSYQMAMRWKMDLDNYSVTRGIKTLLFNPDDTHMQR